METCCGYGYGLARTLLRLARTFKYRQSCTGRHKKCGALRVIATSLSPAKPIPGSQPLTKKRELFPGLLPTNPRSFALPHRSTEALQSPRPGSGILTRFPFDQNQASHFSIIIQRIEKPAFRTALAYRLGPTDPCSNAVHMEPFSTSAFKVLI